MSAGMQLIKKLCNCTMLSIFLIICGCSKKDPGVFHEDFKDKVLNELKASGYSLKGRDITARKQNEIPGYILANPHMKRANESVMTSAEPNFTERFLFKVGNNYILMDFYTINGKTCYVVVHAPESPDNVIGERTKAIIKKCFGNIRIDLKRITPEIEAEIKSKYLRPSKSTTTKSPNQQSKPHP